MNFDCWTSSNAAAVRDLAGLGMVLARYHADGPKPEIEDGRLSICGEEWPRFFAIPDGAAEDWDPWWPSVEASEVSVEHVLVELSEFLSEPLTVQVVGHEGLRFPLAAAQWEVEPGAREARVTGF